MARRLLTAFGPAGSLALLVLMKLANQFATFNYRLFNFNIYELANQSVSAGRADSDTVGTLQCRLKSSWEVDNAQDDPVQVYLFRFAYTFAAIGGLLSSATKNRRLILTLAGGLMTASALFVWLVKLLDLACNRAVYVLSFVPYPLFMTLMLAPILSAFADCRCPSFGREGGRTVALVLYYVASSSTIWFNMGVWKLVDIYRYHGSHLFIPVVAGVLSLAYLIACRLLCPSAAAANPRQQFERPTMRRLLLYFLILTAFILFLVQLNDGHILDYQNEALYYMNANATGWLGRDVLAAFNDWNVPRTVNIIGMLISAGFVALFSGSRRIRSSRMLKLGFQNRLLFGISLGALVAAFGLVSDLCMRAISMDGLPPLAPALIFSLAGFVEGFVEILAMVAAYELVLAIAPPTHRDFVVGIALSIWSFASLLRSALWKGLVPLIISNETVQSDRHILHCLRHSLDLLLCISCLAYTRLVSLRLAAPLMAEESDPAAAVDEAASYDEAGGEMQRLLP